MMTKLGFIGAGNMGSAIMKGIAAGKLDAEVYELPNAVEARTPIGCKLVFERWENGNGEQFDWRVLDHYRGPTPFLLSGGIGPDDVHRVRAFSHPLLAGIDLNSRFETSPGVKDIESLHRFLTQFTH